MLDSQHDVKTRFPFVCHGIRHDYSWWRHRYIEPVICNVALSDSLSLPTAEVIECAPCPPGTESRGGKHTKKKKERIRKKNSKSGFSKKIHLKILPGLKFFHTFFLFWQLFTLIGFRCAMSCLSHWFLPIRIGKDTYSKFSNHFPNLEIPFFRAEMFVLCVPKDLQQFDRSCIPFSYRSNSPFP